MAEATPHLIRRFPLWIIALLAFSFAPPRVCHGEPMLALSTSHYQIHTDLDRPLAMDLGRRMDAMFDEYARRFAPLNLQHQPPLEVYLFASRGDYLQFVGPEYRNTGGLFIPARHLLAAFLEGQGRDTLRRTLQHEAFHQFAQVAFEHELPPWLNEGLAQIFEEAIWTGDSFTLFQVPPRRVRMLQAGLAADPQTFSDLHELVAMTPADWSDAVTSDESLGHLRYNQAWTLVYFLARQQDVSGNAYLPRFLDLLQKIDDGIAPVDAFDSAFADTDELQDQYLEFVQSLRPTPQAILIERQKVLADFVAQLWERGQHPIDISQTRKALKAGKYQLHYRLGSVRWDSDADVTTYFSDADGHLFPASALRFDRIGRQLPPDILCRAAPRLELHTRFFQIAGHLEHETLVEQTSAQRKITPTALD